jgi:hypothetical protein
VNLSKIYAGAILGLILVQNGIAFVVTSFADQPAEDTSGIIRISDARILVFAVNGEDIVFGDGTPVYVSVFSPGPPLDTGKESLDAWPVAADVVRYAPDGSRSNNLG